MNLHPTPQLARSNWLELSGSLAFDYDDSDSGLAAGWAAADHRFSRTIQVPYPPESQLSGIGDTGFHRVLWYQRIFSTNDLAGVAEGSNASRTVLHLGAVDYSSQVYVNGRLAAEHVGGMTPIRADITDLLEDDHDQQTITVRAVDDPHDRAQPRGKQDWRLETEGIFYERTSGIWQPVWLEQLTADHIVDLAWFTEPAARRVSATISLSRPTADVSRNVKITLTDESGTIAESTALAGDAVVRCDLRLPDAGVPLWSPEHPHLIDATVELITPDGVQDRVQSYLGVRSVGVRDGRFLLNGQPYYLRSVLEQGYWPESQLAAPSPEALKREVELIKELGFNHARIHQKVEDPRFLYWCDKLGLALWGEMANAFVFNDQSMRRLVHEWPEVIRRDRSHPSIVAWVPINESWGVSGIAEDPTQQHFATALYHLTKALDPTRPTMSNEGWEHTESDIWGVHDYSPSPDGIRQRFSDQELIRTLTDRGPGRRRILLGNRENRGQPVMITEFGGLSFRPATDERWFGYSTIESDEEFLAQLEGLVTAIADSPSVAGFCYTQFTDTGQETNGLLRADRTAKLSTDRVREIITTPSRAIAAEEVDAARIQARR